MSTATTQTVGTLEDNAQALIDARLDTIERMLLGQVSRGDRLAIVREVEAQIHDLLAERDPNDTDRDAVIATLARLDPPEAYLADADQRRASANRGTQVLGTSRPVASSRDRAPGSTAGKVGGFVGLSSLIEVVLGVAMFFIGSQETHPVNLFDFVVLGMILISLLSTVLAIAFSAYAQLKGTWAIVGLTTGIISLTCFAGSFVFLVN